MGALPVGRPLGVGARLGVSARVEFEPPTFDTSPGGNQRLCATLPCLCVCMCVCVCVCLCNVNVRIGGRLQLSGRLFSQ